MTKTELRLQARELRRQGLSIGAISKELNITKGSIGPWVKDVELTEEQKERLNSRSHMGGLGRSPSSETKEKISSSMKQMWKFKERNRTYKPCFALGSLTYIGIEKYAMPFIEERFECDNFRHERIGKHVFDYCNDKYIIEFSYHDCGITRAITRFATIQNDPRKKYLISPDGHLGKVRRRRLEDLNITHIPLWFEPPE